MTKEIVDPCTRMKGEPKKSNRRLCIYVNFAGSLKEFEAHLRKHHKDLSVSIATLKNESSKWNWQERKNNYKTEQEKQLQTEIEDLYKSLNKSSIEDMNNFFNDINELKSDLMRRFRADEITSTNALRVLKDYIKLYREATEIYYINSRHALFPAEKEQDNETNTIDAITTFVDSLRVLREEQ